MAEGEPSVQVYDHRFKLVVIGDAHVGKTSLLLRYVENSFPDTKVMNVGVDFKIKEIVVDKKKVYLEIWDTAGQERFRTISSSYYSGAHGIALVYDVTDEESFSNLRSWLTEIDRHIYENESVCTVLIGNKTDGENPRRVEKKLAQELADAMEIDFQETSAKENINVEETFLGLVQSIMDSGEVGKTTTHSNIITITPLNRKNTNTKKCCTIS